MLKSINGYNFSQQMSSTTKRVTNLTVRQTPSMALITKKTAEKYQTDVAWTGQISPEEQSKFYELAFLGMTENLTITAVDSQTLEEVTYTGRTFSDPRVPKTEYLDTIRSIYSGAGAVFREV